jgi:hypothetical protein
MKTLRTLTLGAVLAGLTLTASAQDWLTNGLVAYYPFNGNANDASGNAANPMVTDVAQTTDRFGGLGQAAEFNGASSFLTLPAQRLNLAGSSQASISMWVKLEGTNVEYDLFATYPDVFYIPPPSPLGIIWATTPGGIMSVSTASDSDRNFSTTALSPHVWYHLVLVYDGQAAAYSNKVQMYFDGDRDSVLQSRPEVIPSTIPLNADGAWIGARSFKASGSFIAYTDGVIDDVRIYNRALSAAEVQALYDQEKPANTLANGLVAYYPFNGNANDASGNANNGTLIGTQPGTDRFGNANSTYSFNGTSDYIEVPSSPSLAFGAQITASGWICPDRLYPPQGQPGFQSMEILCKGPDVEGAVDWAFAVIGDMLRPHLLLASWTYWDSAGGVQPNAWQHAIFTYDGSTMRTYLNGVESGQRPASGAFRISDGSMRIGAYAPINGLPVGGSKAFFSGKIDDIRIYNRALSATEVADLYALEAAPFCSPHKATATATMANGFVIGATITDPGCGYTNPPVVVISGGGGSGATATAIISNGQVTGLTITSAGVGYTSAPRIEIASPPFEPTVSIGVSRVNVTQHVVLGRNYVLESSTNLVDWTATGPSFTADSETIVTEFVVDVTGRYFRIREVP